MVTVVVAEAVVVFVTQATVVFGVALKLSLMITSSGAFSPFMLVSRELIARFTMNARTIADRIRRLSRLFTVIYTLLTPINL